MIVVNVTGGFANQLYRYACGYGLAKKYNQDLIISVLDKNWYVDAYLLDELEIPLHKKIIINSVQAEEELKEHFHIESIFKITEKNFDEVTKKIFEENQIVYVDAAFQRKKHYIEVLADIREMFKLVNPQGELLYFKERIQNQNSVAVHMRRCDFIYHAKVNSEFTFVYDDRFYQAAIAYLEEKLDNPIFYIISDDIEFGKKLLGNRKNINFINIIGGKDADLEEFFCISMCRYRILTAGSSFGRMADILNDGKDKKTIYAGNRENTDEIIYLDNDAIIKYSMIYNNSFCQKVNIFNLNRDLYNVSPQALGKQELELLYEAYVNADKISKKEKVNLFLIKGICQYNTGDFIHAELTFKKAWQFCNGIKDFHVYYFKTLCSLEKFDESLIEVAMCIQLKVDLNILKEVLPKKYHDILYKINGIKPRHFIIAPKECYKNAMLNRMCNIGILLQRMGHKVEYIFNEANEKDTGSVSVHNSILSNNYMYTDCEGYKYKSKMYDLNKILNQYTIEDFILELAQDKKAYVLTKEEKVINRIGKGKQIQTIFWDFSNPYDSETRYSYNEELVDIMYQKASYIITEDMGKYKELKYIYGEDKVNFLTGGDSKAYSIINDRADLSQLYAYKADLFNAIRILLEIDSKVPVV